MLVIVGHGTSILRAKIGKWLDDQTVVRLKNAPMGEPEIWGTRTDYICTRKEYWIGERKPSVEHWMFMRGKDSPGRRFCDLDRWTNWYACYSGMKPSHGLCAAMCAVEFLNPDAIGVIGFDSMMHPDVKEQGKYNRQPGAWFHDRHAEAKALYDLGPRIINLETHFG